MKYLLSIDGGGTKTEFCISDFEGENIKLFSTGCSNYKSVGIEGLYLSLKEGFDWIKETLSIDTEDIAYGVFGISGCDSENDYEIIKQQILNNGIKKDKIYLCNDGILAFYAQADEPGLVVISGTGSIVIGLDEKGNYKRSGGWGYNISDIGSGYWIGNEALRRTLLYCDNCYSHSLLFDEIMKYFKAKDFQELPYKITEITDYFEIAKIAEIVLAMAQQGEAEAYSILEQGAQALADLAKSTYDKLNFNEETDINIVFSGGVLKNRIYEENLKASIGRKIKLDHITFLVQENPPSYGGIKLAKTILGRGGCNDT